MAFELAVYMGIGVFIGKWLDRYFGFEKPILMIFMVILFFSGYMIRLMKDLR